MAASVPQDNQHNGSSGMSTFILRGKPHVRGDLRLGASQHRPGTVVAIHEWVESEPHSPSWTHVTLTHLSQALAVFCGQSQNTC